MKSPGTLGQRDPGRDAAGVAPLRAVRHEASVYSGVGADRDPIQTALGLSSAPNSLDVAISGLVFFCAAE